MNRPAFDMSAPALRRLDWKAGEVSAESGVPCRVECNSAQSRWDRFLRGDQYTVYTGRSSSGPFFFNDAWSFLNGVCAGADSVYRDVLGQRPPAA